MLSGLAVSVSFLSSHSPKPPGARSAALLTFGNKFNEQTWYKAGQTLSCDLPQQTATGTFTCGERKLTVYSLNVKTKIIYLQKHQATCEFSHLIFHCTVIPEAVLSPKVCQAQIGWSSMCTQGLTVPCTHWCKLQGSITQSQAQSRFSSSSAT